MSEIEKKDQETMEKAEPEKGQEEVPKPLTIEQLRMLGKGVLKLLTPIRAKSTDIMELPYDFNKLSGVDYADAMDSDTDGTNAFRLTSRQALTLFACAAGKCSDSLDMRDILSRIGAVDAVQACQVATFFFVQSGRTANSLISDK